MSKTLTTRLVIAVVLASVLTALVIKAASDPSNPYRQADTMAGVIKLVRQHYVDELDAKTQAQLLERGLAGIMDALGDPHSAYMPPQEFAAFTQEIDGTMVGIGAHVDSDDGFVRIVAPIPGSPAAQAGIRPGDLVVEVDGVSTLDMPLNDAVARIKGQPGTQVGLVIRRTVGDQDNRMAVTVQRGTVQVPAITGFQNDAAGVPDFMLDPQRGVGYVKLREFSQLSGQQVLAAFEQALAAGAKGLIFDLRDNPGGLLTQAVDVTDVFLPAGKLVLSVRYRNHQDEVHETRRAALIEPGVPVCVLVNEQSASAAEIVAGALQDHERAFVVGARTYGKGSVQQPFTLAKGMGAVRLTIGRWYLPSGRGLHRDDSDPDAAWGVDPSAGGYVPVGPDDYFQTLGRRQDFLAGVFGLPATGIDRDWLAHELLDPQLAAAYDALLERIGSGGWPSLNALDADRAQQLAERVALRDQKLALEKQLLEVQTRLNELIKPAETQDTLGDDALGQDTLREDGGVE